MVSFIRHGISFFFKENGLVLTAIKLGSGVEQVSYFLHDAITRLSDGSVLDKLCETDIGTKCKPISGK